MDIKEQRIEWLACQQSFPYFVDNYCQIYDATQGGWIPFRLWPAQVEAAEQLVNNRLNVILKARQLGLTWLVVAYALWLMLFHPSATVLLFSRRETEAIYLLDKRLKGMYKRLPEWMRVRTILSNSSHIWELSNESTAYAFPSTAGDSYTATLAIVDEADLVPDLDSLMLAVKPTIDGGGRMVLLSRSDKTKPNSAFKKLYRAAAAKLNAWCALFIPWFARPSRTPEWYEEQKRDIQSRTGSLDSLYEQYPATAEEALAPRSLNKRIPFEWIKRCYVPLTGTAHKDIPNLTIFLPPETGHSYVISADPAEGNPTSDDSVAHVLDAITLEECALMVGKIEPLMFSEYLVMLSDYYRNAPWMIERNNHGHAVITQLRSKGEEDRILRGPDGNYGWTTTAKSKAFMYATGSDLFKDGVPTIHSIETFTQLTEVEGSTLSAPDDLHDDHAVSYMLGLIAGSTEPAKAFGYKYQNASHRSSSRPTRALARRLSSSRGRFGHRR